MISIYELNLLRLASRRANVAISCGGRAGGTKKRVFSKMDLKTFSYFRDSSPAPQFTGKKRQE